MLVLGVSESGSSFWGGSTPAHGLAFAFPLPFSENEMIFVDCFSRIFAARLEQMVHCLDQNIYDDVSRFFLNTVTLQVPVSMVGRLSIEINISQLSSGT